jgi:NAD(P)-dependent dehydrogenase (short-subunit alcohol dehydrogenase family)
MASTSQVVIITGGSRGIGAATAQLAAGNYAFRYHGTFTILIRSSPPSSNSAVSICPR